MYSAPDLIMDYERINENGFPENFCSPDFRLYNLKKSGLCGNQSVKTAVNSI